MRVLHVLEPSEGGVALHVRTLARELRGRGHNVDAIVSTRGRLAEELRAVGTGVAQIPFRPEAPAPTADGRSARALVRLLSKRRWDVVHTHGNKAGVVARPLAWAFGMPVVHSPHGFAYTSQRRRPRAGMEARRALTLSLERMLAPCTAVIVCASEHDREAAVRDRIARPERLAVVHNGVEAPESVEPDPALLAHRGERPLVGFLARLHEGKVPLDFVAAVLAARDRGAEFKAALVGDGPLEATVRARVAEAGLGNDVLVLPFGRDPAPALAAFDVYVMPSLWESFPIGILEAMAASLPVVATNVGGVPEAVADGETGLLVPLGEVDALSAAIERLVRDPALRRRMGAAGRARWESEFGVARMVDGLEAAYERALAER